MNTFDQLAESYVQIIPMDKEIGIRLLIEVYELFQSIGITPFLRQGTCLGAVRDNDFIVWDDDIDVGSIIGLHGVTESSCSQAQELFKRNGYVVKLEEHQQYLNLAMMKNDIRVDWNCCRNIDGFIYHFPGIAIPIRFFKELREQKIMDQTFYVPLYAEDYLETKYGLEWRIPKQYGFEKDIIGDLMYTIPRTNKLLTKIKTYFSSKKSYLIIHNKDGNPVANAQVTISNTGTFTTNAEGKIYFKIPKPDWYSLIIRHSNQEDILYMESLDFKKSYIYDPSTITTQYCVLTE